MMLAEDARTTRCAQGQHAVCSVAGCGACATCRRPHREGCSNHPVNIYRIERDKARDERNARVLAPVSRRDRKAANPLRHEMTDIQLAEARRLFQERLERDFTRRKRRQPS